MMQTTSSNDDHHHSSNHNNLNKATIIPLARVQHCNSNTEIGYGNGLNGSPCQLLGYRITTTTQICLSYLTTSVLRLLVYVIVTTCDITTAIQHYHDDRQLYAFITLILICLPAIVNFCTVIVSPWQWPEDDPANDADGCSAQNWKFFGKQLINLLLFPVGAVYRLSYIVFWSIEAMFHMAETVEHQLAVEKLMEPSTFELYYFLQAYVQAAPQIILQLYILLRENVFRNYETSSIQVVSVLFSLITMAIISSIYQRFESQKCVGRNYPWIPNRQVKMRQMKFVRTTSVPQDERKPIQSMYVEIPTTSYVINKFHIKKEVDEIVQTDNDDDDERPSTSSYSSVKKSLHLGANNLNSSIGNSLVIEFEKNVEFNNNNSSSDEDDRIVSIEVNDSNILNYPLTTEEPLNENIDRNFSLKRNSYSKMEPFDENPDKSPIFEAPLPPTISAKPSERLSGSPEIKMTEIANRISTFKDMLLLNTEMYIKENIPRLPKNIPLFQSETHQKEHEQKTTDTTDGQALVMPTRRRLVAGIEQDDFVGKTITFTAWSLFITTRMLALSLFSVFYLMACLYVCVLHYFAMLSGLFYETKFHAKIERTYFYVFLAYVFTFCLLEFRVKFRKPRYWYIGYVCMVAIENITISLIWYRMAEYESWWFHYLFLIVVIGCGYSIVCLLLYFCLLKPRDKILFENEQ